MGNEYIINGTEEVVDAFTANSGIVVPAGQTITNNGSYAGTPVVTSIIAGGAGVKIINPSSPGPATISIISNQGFNNLSDYTDTSLNFSLSNNYNIRALALLR